MRASRKKILFSRAADVALTAGLLLLYLAYGVSDIAGINEAARAGNIPVTALLAALCLAVAAILQSALLPVHGWLIEALETPTPASALIHACVVSAGGFLLIRFADVMLGAPFILAILVIIGGVSALAGSVVMLTQSASKTALAWSTVSQMGFVVLLCGLGLFPLALLHIGAHALYKVHAFLTAADAGQAIRAAHQLGPVARPSVRNVAWAMGLATATYALIGQTLGFVDESPQAVTVGAVLVLGIGCLVAQGFADSAPRKLGLATVRASVLFAATYFTLQWVAQNLTVGALPPTPHAGPLEWMLTVLVLLSFAVVAVVQALLPHWSTRPVVRGLRVHATNGFYLNALTDRYTGNWKADPANKET
jgi:NAD(P)H-quinone oxidoreductase subunit 5